MIGPVIRMPLQRAATRLSCGDGLFALVGVAGFLVAYPGWRETGLAIPGISLYGFGVVLVAVGAAMVPAIRSGTAVSAVEADELEPTPEAETVATEDPESEPVDEPAESKARLEVYEDRGGKWRWRLIHRNGDILADGGEGCASRTGAIQGIQSVKRNGPNADVEFQSVRPDGE